MKRFAVLAFLLTAFQARAQTPESSRRALTADSVPISIAAAELDGARSSQPSSADSTTAWFLSLTRATAKRQCVEGGRSSDAQSGEFVLRGLQEYATRWRHGNPKLMWVPAHASSSAPAALIVRATRLDENGDQVVFTHALDRSTSPPVLGYRTGFNLPSSGRWLLVASAGPNWGCFVFTVD
jgi:hypothetical protein